jgi:hypothetical protein
MKKGNKEMTKEQSEQVDIWWMIDNSSMTTEEVLECLNILYYYKESKNV